MRRWMPTLAACLTVAAFLTSVALAAPGVEVVSTKDGTRLLVGGKLITSFRTPNAGVAPQRRAEVAAERLEALLGQGLTAAQVEVRERGGDAGVYAAGRLVMIATAEEGAARGLTPRRTAELWAANLKSVLPAGKRAPAKAAAAPRPAAAAKPAAAAPKRAAAPKPSPKPASKFAPKSTQVTIPVGESRVVTFEGAAPGTLAADTDNPEAVDILPVEGKPALELRGFQPGKATVRVHSDGKSVTLIVWIKKWAGRVTWAAEASVTGDVTPASLVRQSAAERALDAVQREPGTVVKITGAAEGVRALGRGQSATVSFPITITGESYIPVTTKATVRVSNVALPSRKTDFLLYSNDPESVREFGTLFEGMVENSGPVRLLYHHQNRMNRMFTFQIHLVNPSSEAVDVQIIEGASGPFIDTIQVGHRAAERYITSVQRDIGYITRIPPRGHRTVYAAEVPKLLTVSGIYNFRVVNGGPLVAQVVATPEPTRPALRGDLVSAARNEPHTYPEPDKREVHAYQAGGKYWTFVPMGKTPITGRSPRRKLLGNYGVIYDLTLDLSNPTSEEKTVRVFLSAQAGWTRGVFVIDGRLVEAPQIAPPAEAELWTVKLAPGAQRKVRVQGIPVSGSAYPVSLIIRS